MSRDPETDQVTFRQEIQQFHAEKGGMDIVVGGEITASVESWQKVAHMVIEAFGLPPRQR